jgi:hypothetical protein
MRAEEALEQARCDDSRPVPIKDEHEPFSRTLGRQVRVASDDYGRDAIVGELVASSAHEIVLLREHPRVGTVFLHFPRIGFEILPA